MIHLVRLAGIEPTTPWFVAKYSIQLSYSREAWNCSIKRMVSVEREDARQTANADTDATIVHLSIDSGG